MQARGSEKNLHTAASSPIEDVFENVNQPTFCSIHCGVEQLKQNLVSRRMCTRKKHLAEQ